jgi:hypothetical protein
MKDRAYTGILLRNVGDETNENDAAVSANPPPQDYGPVIQRERERSVGFPQSGRVMSRSLCSVVHGERGEWRHSAGVPGRVCDATTDWMS